MQGELLLSATEGEGNTVKPQIQPTGVRWRQTCTFLPHCDRQKNGKNCFSCKLNGKFDAFIWEQIRSNCCEIEQTGELHSKEIFKLKDLT